MALLAVAGCWFGDPGATAPPGTFAPATIAFTANVVALSANAINVRLSYLRVGQTSVLLVDSTAKIRVSSTGSFGWQGVRGFPFELDLTRCLTDPAHVPSGPVCDLQVDIRLLSNGETVSSLRPFLLTVRPGTTNTAATEVQLAEVGTVTPVVSGRPEVGVGGSMTLAARVEDVRGAPIPDSPVQWRSGDAAIARIDERGVVTGVAAGQVELTASAGGRAGSVTIAVTTPSALSR